MGTTSCQLLEHVLDGRKWCKIPMVMLNQLRDIFDHGFETRDLCGHVFQLCGLGELCGRMLEMGEPCGLRSKRSGSLIKSDECRGRYMKNKEMRE
jgi:hypothetical protein